MQNPQSHFSHILKMASFNEFIVFALKTSQSIFLVVFVSSPMLFTFVCPSISASFQYQLVCQSSRQHPLLDNFCAALWFSCCGLIQHLVMYSETLTTGHLELSSRVEFLSQEVEDTLISQFIRVNRIDPSFSLWLDLFQSLNSIRMFLFPSLGSPSSSARFQESASLQTTQKCLSLLGSNG